MAVYISYTYCQGRDHRGNWIRPDLPHAFCVTKWGAVLRVYKREISKNGRKYRDWLVVADPNACDAGMYISDDDVVLVAIEKNKK